ncbi:hypothetical protein Tsp_11742 [Trichinella spiralis]|uniref:hypothetical protein n=1 Tax=Trichinella spiralis TaxID=6334 RepID=UPI0001EFE8AF|nr:hypothetical protein Tsp_11742 [Trichinella spiralis]
MHLSFIQQSGLKTLLLSIENWQYGGFCQFFCVDESCPVNSSSNKVKQNDLFETSEISEFDVAIVHIMNMKELFSSILTFAEWVSFAIDYITIVKRPQALSRQVNIVKYMKWRQLSLPTCT